MYASRLILRPFPIRQSESGEPRRHPTIKLLDRRSEYSLSGSQVHLEWCLYIPVAYFSNIVLGAITRHGISTPGLLASSGLSAAFDDSYQTTVSVKNQIYMPPSTSHSKMDLGRPRLLNPTQRSRLRDTSLCDDFTQDGTRPRYRGGG